MIDNCSLNSSFLLNLKGSTRAVIYTRREAISLSCFCFIAIEHRKHHAGDAGIYTEVDILTKQGMSFSETESRRYAYLIGSSTA